MATELRTKLVVEATTKGGEKVEILVDDLEQLAAAGGDAAPKFQLLAAELRALGQQQDLIAQFAALKKQTGDYAVRAEQAQEATRASALALKEKKAALATAAADEQRLTEALDRQRQVQGDISRAVQAAKEEVRALSAASKQGGADAAVYAERLADTRAQLRTLRAEYRDTGAQIKVLATEQRAASAATREIDASAKLLAVAFERSRQASGKANEAYANGRADLQRLRDTMAAAGVASGDLAASQLRIRDEMERTRAQAARVRNEYAFIGGAAEASAKKQTSSNRKITEGIRSISADLALVRNAYVGLQTAMGLGRAAKGLSDTADEVSNLQARIKLATGDGQLFSEMWRRVSDTAIRTNTSLEATGNLFARLTKVGKEAGLSTQKAAEQSLVVTETINQAIQLSGAAASASDAAVTQLIQGLQSGVLRGDEFNSVMEQAPRLAEALAKGLGVATGQLRGMAEQGDLTADKVIKALQSQARVIQEEFATLPATVGRSVQNLSSAWSLFVNQSDKATGASQLVAQSIDLLAKNLETVAAVALKAGLVVAAIYGVRALAAVRDYAAATLTAAKGLDQVAASGGRAQASVSATSAAMQRAGTLLRGIGYAEIASQLLQVALSYKQLREQQRETAAIEARIDEGHKRLVERLREISAATGVNVTSMRELDAAVAAGLIVMNEATGKWQAAGKAQSELAAAARGSAKDLQTLQEMVALTTFDNLIAAGDGAAIAIKKVSEAFNFSEASGVDAFINTLRTLGAQAKLTSAEISAEWERAIGSLRADQLSLVMDRVTAAFKSGAINAKTFAEVNDKILRTGFEKLGVDADTALNTISDGAFEAISAVQGVAKAMQASGAEAGKASTAIEMALTAAVPKADSILAVDALNAQMTKLANAGQLSADGLTRVKEALDKQRATIEGQIPGIQSLGEALRLLGVKPQKELQALADTAKQAFEKVKASGKATPREINEAWRAMAQAAIDANGGVADAALQAQAAQHNMTIEVDDSGKAMVKSLDGAKKSADDFGEASRHAGTQAADGAAEAVDAIDEVKKAHETVTAVIEYTWLSAATQTSKYREEAAKYADQIEGQWQSMEGRMILSWGQWNDAVNQHFMLLERLADGYAKSLERIDEQQQQLEASNSGAARGVDAMRMRLLELEGTQDQIAEARRKRDEDEVRRQIALQKLEIERATIRGDLSAVARYQQEIDLLNEQLQLIGLVFNAEKKKAQQDKREGNNSSGGSAGGGIGGGGGITTERTVNNSPTFNVYGITDPKEFARKIQPELKRLDALAR